MQTFAHIGAPVTGSTGQVLTYKAGSSHIVVRRVGRMLPTAGKLLLLLV